MAILLGVAVGEYSVCVGAEESILPMVMLMPRFIRILFGMDALPVDTPLGYYTCMLLWFEFVTFGHAVLLGATIISKEEILHTADYIYTKPYKRSQVITGKVIAAVVYVAAMWGITWSVAAATLAHPKGFEPIQSEVALSMLGMLFAQLTFLAFGLLASSLVKAAQSAVKYGVVILLSTYIISSIIEYAGDISFLDFVSPFRYFNAPYLYENGFRYGYAGVTALFVAAVLYVVYYRYGKRDFL